MATSDRKHMDVAKPGSIKIQTGGKPMVVGHESIVNDPTIKPETDTNDSTEENDTDAPSPARTKIRLQPLTDEEKAETTTDNSSDEVADTTEADEAPTTTEAETKAKEVETTKPDVQEADTPKTETTKEPVTDEVLDDDQSDTSKEKEAQEESPAAQEERLQEIISAKEYFVPIKEHNSSGIHTFVVAFLLTLTIVCIILLVLMDAEVLDLGITAPTDFL